ncbi:hypothetical protein B0J12DRAFT_60880 [Macrophomina phaseolina]|uniref:Uncharacterized protein n=1 Tax=Macrophomina phaseolina TaxID=35725 RepID=A0ABQ8GCF2_9PEZI|nr:hypothetical protein B0J12DRAFT_60880 [Macrophomina phaseolina]
MAVVFRLSPSIIAPRREGQEIEKERGERPKKTMCGGATGARARLRLKGVRLSRSFFFFFFFFFAGSPEERQPGKRDFSLWEMTGRQGDRPGGKGAADPCDLRVRFESGGGDTVVVGELRKRADQLVAMITMTATTAVRRRRFLIFLLACAEGGSGLVVTVVGSALKVITALYACLCGF